MYHTKNEISHFFQRAFFAVVTFDNHDGLSSHLTIFANDNNGDFYLVSRKEKAFFKNVKNNSRVSLLIYKEEEKLADIREVCINGIVKIIDNNDYDSLKIGYELLGVKSPFLGNLIVDDKERSKHTMFKVKAEKIFYTSIGEVSKSVKPTIIKRVIK